MHIATGGGISFQDPSGCDDRLYPLIEPVRSSPMQAHFNRNAYMHEQATIGFVYEFGEEAPKLVYVFWMCKPVKCLWQ